MAHPVSLVAAPVLGYRRLANTRVACWPVGPPSPISYERNNIKSLQLQKS